MSEEIINGRFCVPQGWEKQPHALGLVLDVDSLEMTEAGGNVRRICNPGVVLLVGLVRFEKMAKCHKEILVAEATIVVAQADSRCNGVDERLLAVGLEDPKTREAARAELVVDF
ncbi:hypothetical protein PoMZ_10730 [Pyricularia oryzae]|uniref:Uncharacterized protein n=1 Tax=Pyricularia oryzae TaxID=318829 RepID=A0A4P7N4X2_PYROR|nr:hypothetical protein PoMZ_10730 [Pyricularia oryzae]